MKLLLSERSGPRWMAIALVLVECVVAPRLYLVGPLHGRPLRLRWSLNNFVVLVVVAPFQLHVVRHPVRSTRMAAVGIIL